MNEPTPRRNTVASMALLAAAVVFGMILAAGTGLTPPAIGGPSFQGTTAPVSSTFTSPSLPSFADLAEAVEPAVVSIHAVSFDRGRDRRGVDPFEFFFGPRRRGPQAPNDDEGRRSDSGGSGFLVSADGLVVTNNHVIDGASQLRVTVNEREYEATVKGTDPDTDIALLQIESEQPFSYLSLGDSDALRVGDWVMVIGSPLNLDKTVTTGVVSAKHRSIGLGDISFENFIQTDAAINFGNSGGPVVNLGGEVVGIATAINYGAENIGFAVPVSTLKQILPQLRDLGRVERGYLGVTIENLNYLSAQAFNLEEPDGALVTDVNDDTPASRAGLEPGDVILKVDDVKIRETRDLIEHVAAQGPDAEVDLEILRNGERIKKKAKLAPRPGSSEVASVDSENEDSEIEWLGIDFRDLTPAVRSQHGIPEGLDGVWVTDVAQTSPLFDQGLQPGHVITQVNGQSTPNRRAFEGVVKEAGSGSVLRIYFRAVLQQGDTRGSYAFVRKP